MSPDRLAVLAREIVGRLADPGLVWKVGEVREVAVPAPAPGTFGSRVLQTGRVLEVSVSYGSATVRANFSIGGLSAPEAVVQFASGLQDHAIEEAWGAALPACPGHVHPLNAQVVDGKPMWVCPADPDHHRELITALPDIG